MIHTRYGDMRRAAQALDYHAQELAGKLAIAATKPMATQHDLSLAYSPGVAAAWNAIAVIDAQGAL